MKSKVFERIRDGTIQSDIQYKSRIGEGYQ